VRIHGDPLSEVAIVARICGAIHTAALNQRLPRVRRWCGKRWKACQSASFEVPRIVDAPKARGHGHGTLCFYGAPGTGKTALAKHMGKALERPLLIKQASDLMSKYVGETEQNMAAMFTEAEAEAGKAVLLFDKADSFLRDRRGAQRTYEVTEVNKMLQRMEYFNGIFVCTTNLLESLAQAALRRFTFKIKFLPLTRAQRTKWWSQKR
jgi:SpoVK/Ycf46/Vps4 family AAA+-type ATPase